MPVNEVLYADLERMCFSASTGMTIISQITGMSLDTIRRGRDELGEDLVGRPVDRVRLPGGGRRPVEKNSQAYQRR